MRPLIESSYKTDRDKIGETMILQLRVFSNQGPSRKLRPTCAIEVQSFSISVASFTMQGCIPTKVGRPRTAIHLVDRRAYVDLQVRNHFQLSTIRAAAFKICALTIAAPTAVTVAGRTKTRRRLVAGKTRP